MAAQNREITPDALTSLVDLIKNFQQNRGDIFIHGPSGMSSETPSGMSFDQYFDGYVTGGPSQNAAADSLKEFAFGQEVRVEFRISAKVEEFENALCEEPIRVVIVSLTYLYGKHDHIWYAFVAIVTDERYPSVQDSYMVGVYCVKTREGHFNFVSPDYTSPIATG